MISIAKTLCRADLLGVKFSPEDADLRQHTWRLSQWGYAKRTLNRRWAGDSPRQVMAHHEVIQRKIGRHIDRSAGETVDHINCDKLDNRRSNLRVVTMEINAANRPARRVVFDKKRQKWRGQFWFRKKLYRTPYVAERQDAVDAVRSLRRKVVADSGIRMHDVPVTKGVSP